MEVERKVREIQASLSVALYQGKQNTAKGFKFHTDSNWSLTGACDPEDFSVQQHRNALNGIKTLP